jgi:hypothetical protein
LGEEFEFDDILMIGPTTGTATWPRAAINLKISSIIIIDMGGQFKVILGRIIRI